MNTLHRTTHQCHDLPYGKLLLMALCSALLVGGIFAQLPAHADEKSATVGVAYGDLATREGMLAARTRLHQKARQLCRQVVEPWSLSHQPDFVRCVDETTAAAVRQLDAWARVTNARVDADRASKR